MDRLRTRSNLVGTCDPSLDLAPDADLSRIQILIVLGGCTAIWVGLFWNNAGFLPFVSGYDSKDHLAYIKYIQERHALPLPTEGYEMFQPPLYYALSAGVLSALRLSATDGGAVSVLRALTMLVGIANFIFVFLSVRLLFPRQALAQLIGLVTGAFLPMQLYLSHYVTNETLAATLASASIYLGIARPKLGTKISFAVNFTRCMHRRRDAGEIYQPLANPCDLRSIRD